MSTKRPVHEIRLGKIRAAVWGNDNGASAVWFTVTVTRLYKDNDGWKDSTSFCRDDLPVVSKLMDMAFAWIWDHQTTTKASHAEDSQKITNQQ
jgi:hypothetical protein